LDSKILASGGAVPTSSIRTVKLFRYYTTKDILILVLEGVFVLLLIYYIFEEFWEVNNCFMEVTFQLKHEGWKNYLKHLWNYVDWANIIVSLPIFQLIMIQFFVCVIIMRVKQYFEVNNLNVTPDPETFVNFSAIAFSISQERNIGAFSNYFNNLNNR
jgi:hypothetical protein